MLSWPPPPAPTPRQRVRAHLGPPLRTRTFAPLAVAAAPGEAGMHLTEAGSSLQSRWLAGHRLQGGADAVDRARPVSGRSDAASRGWAGRQQPCAQCPAPSQWSAVHRHRVAAICCPGPAGKACRHGDTMDPCRSLREAQAAPLGHVDSIPGGRHLATLSCGNSAHLEGQVGHVRVAGRQETISGGSGGGLTLRGWGWTFGEGFGEWTRPVWCWC